MPITLVCDLKCGSLADKWAIAAGSPTLSATSPGGFGRALRFTTTSAVAEAQHTLEAVKAVSLFSFEFYYVSLPNTTTQIAIGNVTAGSNPQIRVTSAGALLYRWGSNTATTHGTTITAGRWWRLDVQADQGAGTKNIDVYLDAVAGGQRQLVEAASTVTGWRFGVVTTAATADLYIRNVLIGDTSGFPYGQHRIQPFYVNGKGTHSFTSNDFQLDDGTNLATSETTSYLKVDESTMPANGASLTAADYVKQAVIRNTGYLEYAIDASDTIEAPSALTVSAAVAIVSAGTGTHDLKVNDGGSVDAQTIRGVGFGISSTTIRHGYKTFAVNINAGTAWTLAQLKALKIRWGYSDDVTPNPALDSLIVEAAFPTAGYHTSSDSLTNSDATVRTSSQPRVVTDSLNSSPAVPDLASVLSRTPTDTLTSGNAVTRTGSYLRSVADSTTFADAIARTYYAIVSDAVHFGERTLDVFGDIADALHITDAVSAAKAAARSAADSLTSLDAISQIKGLFRTSSNSVTSSDATTRAASLHLGLDDGVTFLDSDSVIRAVTAPRSTGNSIHFSDGLDVTSVATALFRSAVDALHLAQIAAAFRRIRGRATSSDRARNHASSSDS